MSQPDNTGLPHASLIAHYATLAGYHTDATSLDVDKDVDLAHLIYAFYTSPLFKAERAILRLAGHSSSDDEAAALAAGNSQNFAAWSQESRSERDVVMADVSGRTKSWLCAERMQAGTRLWFGSVIVPEQTATGEQIPFLFRVLMRPHLFYSRQLLRSAARNLNQSRARMA